MQTSGFVKFGRILIGCGVGTLIGILTRGSNVREDYSAIIIFAIIAIVIGLTIVFVAKNNDKIEQLQSQDNSGKKQCPNCGLSLTNDCKQCPKCETLFE